jgi:hypothetical protein
MATTSRLSVRPSHSKTYERLQDPLVDEVRLIRSQLSARFQNNLSAEAKDLMKRQKKLGLRLRCLK